MDEPSAAPAAETPTEEAPPASQQYWAAIQDNKAFGTRLKAKLEECREALMASSHMEHVRTAYAHNFGQDVEGVGADASAVTRSGAQSEQAEVRVPHARALAAGVVNIITGAKVAWTALPINNDHGAKAGCVTASGALEYYWKDKGVFAKAVGAVKEAVPLAEAVLFTPWDENLGAAAVGVPGKDGKPGQLVHEGDIAFHNVSTWDVLRDPNYKSWDALPWVAVVLWLNKYDVAATYPDYAAEVMKQESSAVRWTPMGTTAVDSDCIPVTHWFHKTTPALPNGGEAVALDSGCVLKRKALSKAFHNVLPVHRFAAGELWGTPFPYSSFWAALGVCQVADSIHTSLTTNITSTAPGIISAESNSEIAPNSIAGGTKILYRAPGSQPPVAVALQQASQYQFDYLDVLRKEAQQILNLNGTSLGTPDSAGMSGAAMALLSSMAIQNNSDLQGAWVDFVTRIGNCVLALWKEKVSTKRKIAISGRGRSSSVKALELDSEAMKGVDRVLVEIGNPLQQTAAGRFELAQLFLQVPGLVKTPEQLAAVVDTGRLDPLTQDLSNQLLLISQENEKLSDGVELIPMLTDDHRLHVREHPGVGASMEARSDPKVMAALQNHIAQHIKILRETDPSILEAMGQAPLAPPMAPPGAPGAPPAPGGDVSMAPPPAPADAAASVSMPSMPTNPQTGEEFQPAAGAPQ